MDSTVVVAGISLLGTLFGSFAGIMTSSKLSNYRIEQLEKKVEKHNSVVERTAILERDEKTIWQSINEIKGELHELHDERGSK